MIEIPPSAAPCFDAYLRPGQGQRELTETMLHLATLAVFAIPGAEGATVSVFEQNNRTPLTAASIDFARAVDAVQHGLGEGPCLTARAASAIVHSGHLSEDPRWVHSGPEIARHGVHSVLALPLIHGPRVIAVVSAYAYARDVFQARAVTLAELFGGPAAASIAGAVSAARL